MTMPSSLSTFRQVYPLRVCRPVVMIALCLSVCAVLFSPFTNKAAWALDKVNAEVPAAKTVIRGSGLPVPRFVSLKSNDVDVWEFLHS